MALLLKNLLFTLLVPGTVAVYVPLLIAARAAPATGARLSAAIAVLALGACLYAWCVWNFARLGRGTPAPIDAPKRLVVRGPYRCVRNPMYVSVLAVILGQAMLFRAGAVLGYGFAVAFAFHLMVTLYEEPRLQREFGEDYREYCRRVARWLPGRPRAD